MDIDRRAECRGENIGSTAVGDGAGRCLENWMRAEVCGYLCSGMCVSELAEIGGTCEAGLWRVADIVVEVFECDGSQVRRSVESRAVSTE